MDNHYKTLSGPVRSEYSSFGVFLEEIIVTCVLAISEQDLLSHTMLWFLLIDVTARVDNLTVELLIIARNAVSFSVGFVI